MLPVPFYPPLALLIFALHTSFARLTTISNDTPRFDISGNIVPISDGNLLQHQGVYYLYGVKYAGACIAAKSKQCVTFSHVPALPRDSAGDVL